MKNVIVILQIALTLYLSQSITRADEPVLPNYGPVRTKLVLSNGMTIYDNGTKSFFVSFASDGIPEDGALGATHRIFRVSSKIALRATGNGMVIPVYEFILQPYVYEHDASDGAYVPFSIGVGNFEAKRNQNLGIDRVMKAHLFHGTMGSRDPYQAKYTDERDVVPVASFGVKLLGATLLKFKDELNELVQLKSIELMRFSLVAGFNWNYAKSLPTKTLRNLAKNTDLHVEIISFDGGIGFSENNQGYMDAHMASELSIMSKSRRWKLFARGTVDALDFSVTREPVLGPTGTPGIDESNYDTSRGVLSIEGGLEGRF